MVAGRTAGVDATRLSKIGTLWLFLRASYLVLYVVQTKRTHPLRSVLFLWSLALCCNLLREAHEKREAARQQKELEEQEDKEWAEDGIDW